MTRIQLSQKTTGAWDNLYLQAVAEDPASREAADGNSTSTEACRSLAHLESRGPFRDRSPKSPYHPSCITKLPPTPTQTRPLHAQALSCGQIPLFHSHERLSRRATRARFQHSPLPGEDLCKGLWSVTHKSSCTFYPCRSAHHHSRTAGPRNSADTCKEPQPGDLGCSTWDTKSETSQFSCPPEAVSSLATLNPPASAPTRTNPSSESPTSSW